MVKAVVLIGGPSKGTRFRPLSLDLPKPLFPVAGHPLLYHHIQACSKIPDLQEIILLGFYDPELFATFISATSSKFNIVIRFLKESKALGTAGGLLHFRDEILRDNPQHIFVLHCDVCCTFPLANILDFHKKHGKSCTIMGKKIPAAEAHNYGCLAVNQEQQVIHYAEKPETFVSDICNCGVYLFSPQVFGLIAEVSERKQKSVDDFDLQWGEEESSIVSFERDIFGRLVDSNDLFCFTTTGFWLQVKSAGMALKCAQALMDQYKKTHPEVLADAASAEYKILDNVIIHPGAEIAPSAVIGPNVSIGAGVKIGKGVRILHSIILEGVAIKDFALVKHSIIGWNSTIGRWARVEGAPEAADGPSGGMTIFGVGVTVKPEILVRNSIVLPHKHLTHSYSEEILL